MTKNSPLTHPLYILSGATATGKTTTAIKLAKALQKHNKQAEVVNFDSIIFYQGLDIGSAKPNQEEKQGIPHHLIDVAQIDQPLNASDYVEMAQKKIDELQQKDIIPILTGGSAFYLRALVKGMYESKTLSPELKKEIESVYDKQGISPFLDYLDQHDPESIENLHLNDHYRLLRAYEHHRVTGEKISVQKAQYDQKAPYDFSQGVHQNKWRIWHIYLDIPKEKHWEVIQERTQQMIDQGLLDEVQSLIRQGFKISSKPLQSVGYKEVIQFLDGEFESLEECKERISISTRQLAKSQRTFFNKITPKNTYNPLYEADKIIDEAIEFIKTQR